MSTLSIQTNIRTQRPVEVSKIIFIRRKPSVNTRGQIPADENPFIGSAIKDGTDLRGLDFQEEEAYLKSIIGVSPDSDKWEAATRDYWRNMRVRVPDGVGLSLEVGFKYETQEDADYAEASEDYARKQSKGIPINVGNYILYRYCLVYNRVANNLGDINKSPNIQFYMYSKEIEVKDQYAAIQKKNEAGRLYYAVLGDRKLVDHILTMFNQPVENLKPMEKDILLDQYVASNPVEFVQYASDKNIQMKAMIEKAIYKNVLKRYPNTETIAFGTEVLGSDLNEAVIFLSRPAGTKLLSEIKAQLFGATEVLTPIAKSTLKDEIKTPVVNSSTAPSLDELDIENVAGTTKAPKNITSPKTSEEVNL